MKYSGGLKDDIEFEQLKAIYLKLKEVRQKLTELNIELSSENGGPLFKTSFSVISFADLL